MSIIEITICLISVLGILYTFSTSASADNSKKILAELKKHDAALQQGRVIHHTDSNAIIHSANGNTKRPDHSDKIILYYSADGRYHKKTEPLAANSLPLEEIYDGTDSIMVVNSSITQVIFNKDTPSAHMSYMIETAPGPSFVMGRGLSALENINITEDANGVHLSGTSNGSKIEARLDPSHDYVAKEIILTGDELATIKKLKWQLSKPKTFNGSPFIATDSTYEMETKILSGTRHCVIQDADFSISDEAFLDYNWHKPGLEIADSRLGADKRVYYKSDNLPPGITSCQLLTMTKQELARRAKRQFTDKAITMAVIAWFAVTIGVIVVSVLKWDK